MSEKDKLFTSKVKHSGKFDFKELYNTLYSWLVDEGYDVEEQQYKENIGPGGEKEIEVEWEATKKISDYFKNMIKIKWQLMRLSSEEVEVGGIKRKMNKGMIEISVSTILVKDYDDRWTGKPILKFLRTLYEKYLIPARINQYEGKLIGDGDELIAQIKAFLQLSVKI